LATLVESVSELVTVFEITRNSNGIFADTIFRLLIGVAALIGGLIFVVRQWKRESSLKDYVAPAFGIIWSVLWIYLHNFPHVFGHINGLLNAYHEKKYQIVEGSVQVLHQQPATGHTKGDIIRLNGNEFEVNYFLSTPAYRNSIAHKGVLNAGTYARIYYVNREILRIDIRK
jgi:hypothetical protein